MVRMARDCDWPADVFQVVTGSGGTGQALVDEADFVMFTGSTRTGRRVAARAAERLVPHTLELGGKDAMIVLADAPLARAANLAVIKGATGAPVSGPSVPAGTPGIDGIATLDAVGGFIPGDLVAYPVAATGSVLVGHVIPRSGRIRCRRGQRTWSTVPRRR